MALTDLEKLFVYTTANQIWQQDLLMNAYFQGSSVGANLREMVLGRPAVKPLTNPYDQAITGRLRADSATIRQGARNVTEAASMVGIAAEAVGTIKSTLEDMQDIATKIKTGELVWNTTIRDEYNSLRDKITGIVQSTLYNGIALLDSTQWGTDQIDSGGAVHVQAFLSGGFDVTFKALDSPTPPWSNLSGASLNNATGLQTELLELSELLGYVGTVEDIYTKRASGLNFQASSLESQADLLDQAVEARRQSPTLSLEEILVRLLLRDTGTLMDELT
ncbi:flagellin [Desulfomicrobium salsuginis]